MKLAELQKWMLQRIAEPHWPEGVKKTEFDKAVVPNDSLTSTERIDIYMRMYFFRIRDVLLEDYEVLSRLVGRESFISWVRRYLKEHPTTSFTLAQAGKHFPSFLKKDGAPPWQWELAELEWAECCARDALDAPRLTTSEIEQMKEWFTEAMFVFHPSVRFLNHSTNTFQIMADNETSPQDLDQHLVVWRNNNQVWRKELADEEALFLLELREGKTVMEAIDAALAMVTTPESFAGKLQGWFADWVEQGYFSSVHQ